MKSLLTTTVLAVIGAVAPILSCESSTPTPATADAGADAGVEGGAEAASDAGAEAAYDAGPRLSDIPTTANRSACQYARGALPAETLGASIPIGGQIPIEHIVVVMMENHSFDNYLGHLNQYGNRSSTDSNYVESAPADATNPDTVNGTQAWIHAPQLCSFDTDHGWAGTHKEINGGMMDGFAQVNEATLEPDGGPPLGGGGRALWWYDERDLPFYYALANTYAIADHYFCSVPGPTWPNRMYLYAATSFGGTRTGVFPPIDHAMYPYPGNPETILDELEAGQISWTYYSDGPLPTLLLLNTDYSTRWNRTVSAKFAAFQTAAQAGMLPQVSFVDPNLNISTSGSGSEADEHPPGDIQTGQQFVSQVVDAVTTSPQWAHTALFITHDEHGGFYDHVPPPKACAPDSIAPIVASGDTTQGGFDLYGIRVILIAVSPYAKKGYVGHHVYDHTSITRFIEARFNLPALTTRDANADPLTDLFDFSNAPAFLSPPKIPSPTVDPAGLSYCTSTFGP
jgi:phospholipase C